MKTGMTTAAFRLHPGQDLLVELERFANEQAIDAACALACVGSLTTATLRFANQEQSTVLCGHFEIVSLTGTLSRFGSHLHISISDNHGKTTGAHLMPGSTIYTTAEIVLGIMPAYQFQRTMDPQTGYPELDIHILTNGKEHPQ